MRCPCGGGAKAFGRLHPNMVFSRKFDNLATLERELPEWTNFANFQGIIRAIRRFAEFALKNFRL